MSCSDTFELELSSPPGDAVGVAYEFFFDINNGQISTFRLHGSEADVEGVSMFYRPDGAWLATQYGGYGKYRPIRISAGELPYAGGSPVQQIVVRPEATLLGGDYGWDALRILTPDAQPANFMVTQAPPSGLPVGFRARGSDANVGFVIDTQGTAPVILSGSPTGTEFRPYARFTPLASWATYFDFVAAAAGGRNLVTLASATQTDATIVLCGLGVGGTMIENFGGGKLGFFGNSPIAKPTVTGSTTDERLLSLLTALKAYGFIGTTIV